MSIESTISLAKRLFSRNAFKVNYFSCPLIICQNLRIKKKKERDSESLPNTLHLIGRAEI